jgi:uncharacterized repeat protein (TIGR03803 family)
MKPLLFAPLLVAGLGLLLARRVTAQTFTTLYSFTGYSDGGDPGSLISSGDTLYGMAGPGCCPVLGTVYAINTDGSGFTILHTFPATSNGTNSDGSRPVAPLVLSGSTLYGTAPIGGAAGNGTVLAVTTDGMSFTTLHNFSGPVQGSFYLTNSDGAQPSAGLTLSGSTLYGTTSTGGTGSGTVFKINVQGTGFATLHSFTEIPDPTGHGPFTNDDGAFPRSPLILSGDTLYGATGLGGTQGSGTVFKLKTDGTGFAALHSFSATVPILLYPSTGIPLTNSDGARPGGLLLSGRTLYGTTASGGSNGLGTVFALDTDGTGFRTLHVFNGGDGALPSTEALVLSTSTLYGTTATGGPGWAWPPGGGNGTVFQINTDGSGFTTLYAFTPLDPYGHNSDGESLRTGLLLLGNSLYGTAAYGGDSDQGTIFSISVPVTPPQLAIGWFGGTVVLSWPATTTGFTLQSTTNLGPAAFWTTNFPTPVVVNGQNTITNPISGTQQYFRLASP